MKHFRTTEFFFYIVQTKTTAVTKKTQQIMSSNLLTDDQPVEVIKKFKFFTNGDKDEIEIVIPEVRTLHALVKLNRMENKYGRFNEMRKTGSKLKMKTNQQIFARFVRLFAAFAARIRILQLASLIGACLVRKLKLK